VDGQIGKIEQETGSQYNTLKIKAILFILLFSTPLYGFDNWRTQDYIGESILGALVLVDYCQTLPIINGTSRCTEENPILGKHPTRKRTVLFGTSCLIFHGTVTHIIPSEYRWWWQCVGITIEGMNIVSNFQVELKMSWPWQ
jgi:hypothetical protein